MSPGLSARNDEIEQRIDEFFEQNLVELQADRGHALSPAVREMALQQVRLYWRRLRDIAEKVTDTEVKLSLPDQQTRAGRRFTLEGIVDIVREEGRTMLYDIKTHSAEAIQDNLEEYERQLNVYAYIWQELRGERLDGTAVICTQFPTEVQRALERGDAAALDRALAKWEPVIPVPFDRRRVRETIAAFAEAVDGIEDHEFDPPPLELLKRRLPGMRTIFAVAVCRNCDARFTCAPYREYALGARGAAESAFRQYIEDLGADTEREGFIIAALDAESEVGPQDLT